MKPRLAQLSLSLLLAFGVVAGAHAQTPAGKRDQAVLPVWNQSSGKVEALLLLEPAGLGSRTGFDGNALDAAFGIQIAGSINANTAVHIIVAVAAMLSPVVNTI